MFRLINSRLIQSLFEINKINNNRLFCSAAAQATAPAAATTTSPIITEISAGTIISPIITETIKTSVVANFKIKSKEEEEKKYTEFYEKDGSKYKSIRELNKSVAFKNLDFKFQMKYLEEHQFEDTPPNQVENYKIRMKKQYRKDLQRVESISRSSKVKKRNPDPCLEHLQRLKALLESKNDNFYHIFNSYSNLKSHVNDDVTRLVLEAYKIYYQTEEFNRGSPFTPLEGILKRISFTKFPVKELVEVFSSLNLFKNAEFYQELLSSTETSLYVFLYEVSKYLKSEPNFKEQSNSFKYFIPDGSGAQARMLNGLIVNHRREEAFQTFEACKEKATGEFIYYFVCGLIKMGYVEKSKLIMSQHFDKLSNDPYYLLTSINVSLALGKVELACNLLLKCGEMSSMVPIETVQMITLELGRLKKFELLAQFEPFIETVFSSYESKLLLFNAYQGLPETQSDLLKTIEQSIYRNSVTRNVQATTKKFDVQSDQDNKMVGVQYKLIHINYEDENFQIPPQ